MNKFYTTVEQSSKLVEYSVDCNTADYSYVEIIGDGKGFVFTDKTIGEHFKNIHHPQLYNFLPVWSLGALLEIMPKKLYSIVDTYNLTLFEKDESWVCGYFSRGDGEEYCMKEGKTSIDAVFGMLCELLDKKLMKK